MFERIVNFIKGAISKMFNTTDIAKDFNIDISTSDEVLSAIERWSNIYNGKAPWLNEEIKQRTDSLASFSTYSANRRK